MRQGPSGSAPLTLGVEGTYLPRDRRGMGRYVRNVLEAWKQGGRGHRVVLLARTPRHRAALQAEMPGWPCASAGAAPNLDACWFPWNRVDWDPGCPAVVTVHDVASFAPGAPPDEEDRRRLRQAASRADRIVTVSEFSRAEIARHLQVPPERIEAVLEGVEPEFRPEPRQPRPEFLAERTGGRPFALFVGNEEPRKGLRQLLEAFAAVADRVPHVLVLSGAPPRPPGWLARLAGAPRPLGEALETLGDRVLWARGPDDETLRDYYRHCDLFVCPSLYEGFGLPLLEAMACGAPVAAARRASLPEVGGDVPRWFDPCEQAEFASALLECLADPEPLRGRGVARARTFRWEATADRILEILESCARALSV